MHLVVHKAFDQGLLILVAPGFLLLLQLDISYDAFVRTTSSKHKKLVHEILKRVWEKGDIYLSDYEGW